MSEECVEVSEIMANQTPQGYEHFICSDCAHWKGGCGCKKGYFISCEGAYIPTCLGYVNTEEEQG